MSRKRKILDILGMILGVLLVIVNGMMVVWNICIR